MTNIEEIIRNRRSVRKFNDKPITDNELSAIVEAGRWAPTGGNCQTVHFLVITTIRPEQVKKYQETLDMLTDRLYDSKGTESIPLSVADAQYLAEQAKAGDATAKVLKQLGVSAGQVIRFEYIVKQAFKAGTNAATLSLVLNLAPEIIKAINCLIESEELDAEQFKQVGFAALTGASEGFVRGSISSAITIACKSGMLGDAMIEISPSVIGMATVVTMDTMKNSFYVACGRMTRTELSQELIRELIVSTSSMATGTVVQAAIGIPVVGFMIGSFVGSAMALLLIIVAATPS